VSSPTPSLTHDLIVDAAWDQGSSSIVPSLPGFQHAFNITSGSNPSRITNLIFFVYLTAGVGAASLSLEHIDALFEGPFWHMNRKAKRAKVTEMVIDKKRSDYADGKDALHANEKYAEMGTSKV
jgi:hypothetical protein